VNDIRALHDHTWPVVQFLHLEHMLACKWMKGVKKMKVGPAAIDAQLRLVEARYDTTWELLEQRDTPEAPVLGSNPEVQSCDSHCVVQLYPAISRINGAIPNTADRVNVTMQHHMVTPEGLAPDFLRDNKTTLTVTEDILAGSFLAVLYNPGLAQDSPHGHFKTSVQPFILATRCRERAGLRAVIAQILAVCGPLLPAMLRAHLEACAQAPQAPGLRDWV